jgi:hypothetical protein
MRRGGFQNVEDALMDALESPPSSRLDSITDTRQSATTNRAAPFKTSYGALAKFGPAPSAEDIDANRAEIFGNFGESQL